MKNVRINDNCYTLPIVVNNGQVNNASTPIYFTGYPVLRNKTIKRIAVSAAGAPITFSSVYFTFFNGNKEKLVVNQPASDLQINPALFSNPRPRFYNLYDIDLQNSYWIISWTGVFPGTFTLFNLHFYF